MVESTKIRELATSVRQIFMAILADCNAGSSTKGSCAHATFLTWQCFEKFTSYQCILRGGMVQNMAPTLMHLAADTDITGLRFRQTPEDL